MSDYTPIPVTIISGFLGAGKTSYINKLIANDELSANSIIMVNDFGSINIDFDLIDYADDKILKMQNGCICCTLGGSFAEQLGKALDLQETIANIFVESSGVANPEPIAHVVKMDDRFTLNTVICLLDGSQCLNNMNNTMVADIWHKQIMHAQTIFINRIDKNDTVCVDTIKKINNTAEIIIDDDIPDSHKITHKIIETSPHAPSGDFKSSVQSFAVQFNKEINKQSLEDVLSEYSSCLLRAKGCVKLQNGMREIIQLSGNTISWFAGHTSQSQIVCIGYDSERFTRLKNKILAL